MLQEAKDLQQKAVAELLRLLPHKNEITFRAPTGSGKTRMMSDFMNQFLSSDSNVIFIVSTLSKGGLAEQNYAVFKTCADNGTFPHLNPYLINSETGGEERLFIPSGYNVYVLPRDLYKDKSKLKDQGAFLSFLQENTTNLFGSGENKKIILIKDECHQATNNLDELRKYFDKVINFSATPNLKRGQNPDVEITDHAAEQAKLIKMVEWGEESDTVETAICKFEAIKEDYRNLIGVNPCLIIQISNKAKADTELAKIKSILNQPQHQSLKWMSIVDKKEKCETNDKVSKLPVERWKEYAKGNSSTIDIIIFKMVISEGWDIPRACMLYQVRESQSKQLDEQVMGRVRRNPRLSDFETLSPRAQNLATTAWVWGMAPKGFHKVYQVKLFGDKNDIPSAVKVKTTKLKPLTKRKNFNINTFIKQRSRTTVTSGNIFELYAKLQRSENEVQNLCYDFANDYQKWFSFCQHIDDVKNEYDTFVCDYSQSMEVVKDENGNSKESSFPLSSIYVDNQNYENISEWVWHKKNKTDDKFSFDSEAERKWASRLKDLSSKLGSAEIGEHNPRYGQLRTDGTPEPERLSNETKYLWGKNFLMNSEIRYEYYLNGIHNSYPDFILKDSKGTIHLFEVKSVNVSNSAQFDTDEYRTKVNALKECYKQCSKLTKHIFYLPVLKGDVWQIFRFKNGEEDIITLLDLQNSL